MRPAHHAGSALLSVLLAACAAGETAPSVGGQDGAVTDARLERAAEEPGVWLTHGGTYAERRYSALDRIDRESVDRLGLVWSHDIGLRGGIEATPLMVDGALYLTGPWSVVYALDARTGERLWAHDPRVPRLRGLRACCGAVNRGVAFYRDKVYVGTLDGRLLALEAATGEPVWSTLTVDRAQGYTITGAPRVVRGLVVIGNGGAEYGVRGYVSAYDAETGELAWRTYTVPGDPSRPFESPALERAAETWSGRWWEAGGGGTVWDGMAYDPELDLLYVGTGNGSPWNRHVRSPDGGDNLYLSSILALRPTTGELAWHYQTTPGDHWDFTATQPILLADLEIAGRTRKALMQAPKNGFFYVLDRETGEPVSADPYVPVSWAEEVDLETGRPVERPEAVYGDRPARVTPAIFGGHNWQPMAFHPGTGLVYLPVHELEARYTGADGPTFFQGIWDVAANVTVTVPPAGFLLAWDPVERRQAWRVPLTHWWNGGTLATAGGLVFQGGGDGRFVAYDAETGEVLWEASTGIGIIGAPITWELDGVQHVTIAAGWGGAAGRQGAPAGEAARWEQRGRVLTFALDGEATAPPLAERRREPFVPDLALPTDRPSLERGAALYYVHCLMCHGPGGGSEGAMPNLQRSVAATHESFGRIVLEGTLEPLGMPSFRDRLSPQEATLVHAYIVSEARKAAGQPD